ncbi:hypothetical protein I4U23_014362 [Adineta vaga]|nr:hypothetical protein I4U23_014362 [Adineta vaga]
MPPYTELDKEYQSPTINVDNVNQYRIRPMTELDIETVVKIEQDTWKDYSWRADIFFDAIHDPACNCWILETTTIGHSIIGYGLQHTSDDTAHIRNLTLHPTQCGRGLGGLLLRHMIDHAREYGALQVELQLHVWNMRAYSLYIKHGFTVIDYLDNYYEDRTDAYVMELKF